jgi:UDPglucose 6-dehydrogenase
MREKISVVGLGKLGLPLAACFAERGFDTLGVDLQEEVVKAINLGITPLMEPELGDMIGRLGGRKLIATLEHKRAIEESDISIVLVATPSNPDGDFSNRYVEMALQSLAEAFGQSRKAYHLFVISSTVMPGSTDGAFIPLIEAASGRRLGEGFDVCYIPDFVALGQVVQDFLNPDIVVLGETSPEAGARMEAVYRQLCMNDPYIGHMSIISGEIAKVSLNAYITTKISFANMLSNLCECIPGADVDAITQTISQDKRIAPYYFRGGMGYGGTCFPRDTWAFLKLAEKYELKAELISATEKINEYQNQHLLEMVLRESAPLKNKTIGVLGLAFKTRTPVITKSPSIWLVESLLERGLRVVVYDPLAHATTNGLLGDRIQYTDSAQACMRQSGVCVLMHSSLEMKQAVEGFAPDLQLTLVDGWRRIDPSRLDSRITYVPVGRASMQEVRVV